MQTLINILIYIVSVAFVIVVLIQPDRSHGMTGGGAGSNSLFGVSEDGGPLLKITMYLGATFLVLTLLQYLISK
ncbi:MAG: preprotein translocase subunit SecG [Fusobacteriaceae bacterium]|nr:preprotein translocase subunit SecG [Fusobacteriaceae bacterium]MBN2837555.1 preprotein translocase subunit SecG [Fusobacteriaceae bacterium]